MKKIAIMALTVASLGTAHAANDFAGPYAGVTLGSYAGDLDFTSGATTTKIGEDGRDTGVGVALGYTSQFDGFNLGVELQVQNNLGKVKYVGGGGSITGQITSGWNVSLLPGIMATPDTLIYGRIGKGNIETEATVTPPGVKDSTGMDSLLLGLGVKHAFSDNMTMSLEYKKMTADKTFVFGGLSSVKYEIEGTGLELGLQYNF